MKHEIEERRHVFEMQIVLRESDRLNRIVSDFLTYARPSKIETKVIELASLLAETIALLRNSPELRPDLRGESGL